jgi:predicted transcriptional regulator
VTKQGAIKLMQQLLEVGLVRRVGTRKSGRYVLA